MVKEEVPVATAHGSFQLNVTLVANKIILTRKPHGVQQQ